MAAILAPIAIGLLTALFGAIWRNITAKREVETDENVGLPLRASALAAIRDYT